MKKLLFSLVVTLVLYSFISCSVGPDEESSTGASAMGNALIRFSPLYGYYYGGLKSYVANNREHFVEGGDAIRCAQMLSNALIKRSIELYDPNDWKRRQRLNARIRAAGLPLGDHQPTASEYLYDLALDLARLARVLPAAAKGNYEPLRTPVNEHERLRILGEQLFPTFFLQDPTVVAIMQQHEPLIRELANLDYQILVDMADIMVGR